jgi:Leucine-rich repeat (LRR) protein
MCIICKAIIINNNIITYDLNIFKYVQVLRCCNNIKEIPNIKGLVILDCSNTNIKKIPYIIGLKMLNCSDTNITEIPNIKGLQCLYCCNTLILKIPNIENCEIFSNECRFLEKINIIIFLQKWFRKLKHRYCIQNNINKINKYWYMPGNIGYLKAQKSFSKTLFYS